MVYVLVLSSCGVANIEYSISEKDNNSEINNCEIEKQFSIECELDGYDFELTYNSKFEKRWINRKSQWIPTNFDNSFNLSGPSSFSFIPYGPELAFEKDSNGWLTYDLIYFIQIGEIPRKGFNRPVNAEFDYFTYNLNLDTIAGKTIEKYPPNDVDYHKIDTSNQVYIKKHFRCFNTPSGLKMELVEGFDTGVEKLATLTGMSDSWFREKSNLTDFIPNSDTSLAGYKENVSLPKSSGNTSIREAKISGTIYHCFKYNNWQNLRDSLFNLDRR